MSSVYNYKVFGAKVLRKVLWNNYVYTISCGKSLYTTFFHKSDLANENQCFLWIWRMWKRSNLQWCVLVYFVFHQSNPSEVNIFINYNWKQITCLQFSRPRYKQGPHIMSDSKASETVRILYEDWNMWLPQGFKPRPQPTAMVGSSALTGQVTSCRVRKLTP